MTNERLPVKERWRIAEWDDEGGQFRIEYKSGGYSEWLCVTDEILEKYWMPNAVWPEEEWRPATSMPAWAVRG
jgi:hypothetical protein